MTKENIGIAKAHCGASSWHCKPTNSVPVGWLPVYNESRDQRPAKGYETTSATKIRLHWTEFFERWAEQTKYAVPTPWAEGVTRMPRLFIGGVMGDRQEGDKYTGKPCPCHGHRCFAPRDKHLHTAESEVKTLRI